MLRVENITKRFATAEGGVTAVEGLSLEVPKGRFVAVIGPSGCGKSTLFNIIGGLVDGYEGRVLIDGQPVSGVHRDVGMVFQEGWRWTIAMAVGQSVAMVTSGNSLSLWPLAVLAMIVYSPPQFAAGYASSWLACRAAA